MGLLDFGSGDCIMSRFLGDMISLLANPQKLEGYASRRQLSKMAGQDIGTGRLCLLLPEASRELWKQVTRAGVFVDGSYWVIRGYIMS